MKKHIGKIIAPIIIAAIFIVIYIGYFLLLALIPEIPLWIKILLGLILLSLTGAFIAVLIERIKEIRSGEEDDLSNY